jgi:hypothetical protein
MRGKDVADVAAWAHKVNEKFPWTSALHFQKQPDNQCSVSVTGDNCEGNLCLLPALKYFFAHLTGETGPELKLKGGVKFTDADALKYLINLIGDLHQPMHLGFESHNSGKEIQVEYRGKTSDLFTFMDSGIAAEVLQHENQFWWSGWTNVREERQEYAEDQATWKRLGADSFDKWANETARIVCDTVERLPTTKKPLGKKGDKVRSTGPSTRPGVAKWSSSRSSVPAAGWRSFSTAFWIRGKRSSKRAPRMKISRRKLRPMRTTKKSRPIK